MISWMQKQRKYLVITIWISTIAFVGAGFVGWGSYEYGSKAGAVAKVGDEEIKMSTFQLTYQNLYNRYNQMLGGNMDEKTAKELGLKDAALNNLINQTHFLNLAQEYGVVVSDEELARELASIQAFRQNGTFSKELYKRTLQGMRLQPKEFESILRNELKITKLLNLFNLPVTDREKDALSAMVADKIEYKVLTTDDVSVSLDEKQIKKYYEENKQNYKTKRNYKLEVLWTTTEDIEAPQNELKSYYETKRFDYRDEEGKILPFEEARAQLVKDYKLERAKKQAQRDYIKFKNGEEVQTERMSVAENAKFSPALWEELLQAQAGDVVKPKRYLGRYATVKLLEVIKPQVKPYAEVKELVAKELKAQKLQEKLRTRAQAQLESFKGTLTGFVSPADFPELRGLNRFETNEFAKELFNAQKEQNLFLRGNKAVLYRIVEQKLINHDQSVSGTKQTIFEANLLDRLKQAQPTQVYIK